MQTQATNVQPITVTTENFEEVVLRDDGKPVLVDFWAPWCGPCRMMDPVLKELATEFGDRAVIAKVNVDEQPQLASAAHIRAIPTLHLVKSGEIADVFMGAQAKQKLAKQLTKFIARK